MKGLTVMGLGRARGSSSVKGGDHGGCLWLEDLTDKDDGVFVIANGGDGWVMSCRSKQGGGRESWHHGAVLTLEVWGLLYC